MRRLRLGMMSGGLPPFLLDTYSGAFAAYSVRKLRGAYNGSAIRVRRASDNAEQNIGFDINGDLDTSALTTFCTGTNGFVTTWFDQSGNIENLTQASATSQPKIFDSVSGITTISGKPTIIFDGINDFMYRDFPTNKNQPIYVEMVSTFPTTSFGFLFDSSVPGRIYLLRNALTSNMEYFAGASILSSSNSFNPTSRYLHTAIFNGANSFGYQNLIQRASGNAGSNLISDLYLGSRYTIGNYGDISTQELIFWPTNQSSNRTSIGSNIITYYGI